MAHERVGPFGIQRVRVHAGVGEKRRLLLDRLLRPEKQAQAGGVKPDAGHQHGNTDGVRGGNHGQVHEREENAAGLMQAERHTLPDQWAFEEVRPGQAQDDQDKRGHHEQAQPRREPRRRHRFHGCDVHTSRADRPPQ